jgi:competence protein ComEC
LPIFNLPAFAGIGLSLLLIYSTLFIFRQRIKNQLLTGIIGGLILIFVGYFLSFLRTEKNSSQHYSHQIGKFEYFEVVVDNLVEEKENSWKTVGVIRSVITNNSILPTSGKILLYFDNKSIEKPKYGDVLFVKGNPQEIASPKNPEEFDYQNYMSRQNIDYQQYLRVENFEKAGN